MDPTFVDILTAGTDEDARAQAQAMAQQIRRQKMEGLLGLAGGRRSQMIGSDLSKDADFVEKGLLSAGINRLHYGQQAQELKQRGIDSAEQRALAVQHLKNLAASGHDATALEIARLKAAAGLAGKPTKPLPGKELDTLQELDNSLKSIEEVQRQFDPKYAGQGLLGTAKNTVGRVLGSWGPKSAQEQNNFWAAFNMLVNLPTRHKFFGSALTPTEAKSWSEAQNLGPGTDPKIIKDKFDWMINTARNKLNTRVGSRRAEGVYSPEAIQAAAPHADEAGAEAGMPEYARVNGKLVRVR